MENPSPTFLLERLIAQETVLRYSGHHSAADAVRARRIVMVEGV